MVTDLLHLVDHCRTVHQGGRLPWLQRDLRGTGQGQVWMGGQMGGLSQGILIVYLRPMIYSNHMQNWL